MKSFKFYIVILFIFVSCNSRNEEEKSTTLISEITIPLLKKNSNNARFKINNGVLFFEDSPYSGVVEEFYSKEKLKSIATYYQGKRQGDFKGWHVNGSKWFERFYTAGVKTGIHIGWFDSGKKMFEYHFNNKGEYDGIVRNWYENGMLLKEFHFKDGKEDGSQKMWQPNGKIKANFVTIKGERFGLIGLKKCYSVNIKNEEFK